MQWCWVNFHCLGVLLIWIIVGQGLTVVVVGAGWGCLHIFSLVYPFSPLPPSLWETARYRLKYCLKGPLNRKQPANQPTSQPLSRLYLHGFCVLKFYCTCIRCCVYAYLLCIIPELKLPFQSLQCKHCILWSVLSCNFLVWACCVLTQSFMPFTAEPVILYCHKIYGVHKCMGTKD